MAGQLHGLDPAGVGVHAEVQLPPGPARPACRASRPATRRARPAAGRCCPPAGAAARCPSVAAAPPASRPGGSGWCGRARPGRARAGGGWSRSAPRSGAGQAEHGPQRQRGQDRQGRVPGLPAPGRARLRAPGRDRLLREPDRQAPALAQGGVVLGPVRDPVPLPRDAVAASGVGLERHGRGPGIVGGAAPLPTRPLGATRTDPCTKVAGAAHGLALGVERPFRGGDRLDGPRPPAAAGRAPGAGRHLGDRRHGRPLDDGQRGPGRAAAAGRQPRPPLLRRRQGARQGGRREPPVPARHLPTAVATPSGP